MGSSGSCYVFAAEVIEVAKSHRMPPQRAAGTLPAVEQTAVPQAAGPETAADLTHWAHWAHEAHKAGEALTPGTQHVARVPVAGWPRRWSPRLPPEGIGRMFLVSTCRSSSPCDV
jgi:hypothetical protein